MTTPHPNIPTEAMIEALDPSRCEALPLDYNISRPVGCILQTGKGQCGSRICNYPTCQDLGDGTMSNFHWRDGTYFRRTDDGSVRVVKAKSFDDPGEEVFTIDANSWASIVSSVSKGGEAEGRYYTALAFHND